MVRSILFFYYFNILLLIFSESAYFSGDFCRGAVSVMLQNIVFDSIQWQKSLDSNENDYRIASESTS